MADLTQTPPEALPPEVLGALGSMMMEEQAVKASQDLEVRKHELHQYLKNWLSKAMMYRKANFESKWDRWRRNASSIYDPKRLAQKESWQNRMFVPLSLQTKEIVKQNLYKTLAQGLPYSLQPYPSGNLDQALSIKELLLRELRRSKYEVKFNGSLDDIATYGTMFLKLTWVDEKDVRPVRVPVLEPMTPEVIGRMQYGIPPQTVGYRTDWEERTIYRGLQADFVSIWDLFFPDRCKTVRKAPVIQRTKLTYQYILDGIQKGWAFPESQQKLYDVWENGQPELDKQQAHRDHGMSVLPVPRTRYEKEHTVYEAWMPLPQKWVYLRQEDQQLIFDPDRLVPAKVQFTAEALISVDFNPDYCGDNPFESTNYIGMTGSVYGMGPLEMIEQIQDHLNEDVNQRKDNEQIAWNRMFAIMESAIVSKADLVSRPGGGIRIKKNATDDVRKAIQWAPTPDVPPSSFEEPFHAERYAAEVTGINRTTIGSGGSQAQDVTQTKGGMQILAQVANDRMAYYAQLIEADAVTSIIKKVYSLIYQNITPEEVFRILGPNRAALFQLLPPEEVENDYKWEPEGVFNSIHQPIRIAQWQAFRDQFNGTPWFNDMEMAQVLAKAIEIPRTENVVVPLRGPDGLPIPFEIIQHAMINGGAPPEMPGQAGAEGTTPRIPTKKASRNGPTGMMR